MAVAVAAGTLPGLGPVNPSSFSSDTSTDSLDSLQQQMGDQTMQALIVLLQQVTKELQSAMRPQDTGGQASPGASARGMPGVSTMPSTGDRSGGNVGTITRAGPSAGGSDGGVRSGGATGNSVGGSIVGPAVGPAVCASTSTSTGNGPNGGSTDLVNAMSATEVKDSTLFAKMMKHAKCGDGNARVKDEVKAYKDGDIAKDQAIEEVRGAQNLESSEAILTAAQTAMQQGDQIALQDRQSADPALAKSSRENEKFADGNAMVDGVVLLKQREQNGHGPATFTHQDEQTQDIQVGDVVQTVLSPFADMLWAWLISGLATSKVPSRRLVKRWKAQPKMRRWWSPRKPRRKSSLEKWRRVVRRMRAKRPIQQRKRVRAWAMR